MSPYTLPWRSMNLYWPENAPLGLYWHLCAFVLPWATISLHGPNMLLWAFIGLYGLLKLAISERNIPFILVNKMSDPRNKTYPGLISMLQGFRKFIA